MENININSDALNFSFKQLNLPIIYQEEIAECGLACTAMISAFYGGDSEMRTMRSQFGLTSRGANLKQLVTIASKIGLSARVIKVEMEDLDKVAAPAILHWNSNHFVVLKRVTKNQIEIHDPALGFRRLSLKDAAYSFTGIAVELYPTIHFKPEGKKVTLKMVDLLSNSVGLTGGLAQIALASFIVLFFSMLVPYYTQIVMDNVIAVGDKNFMVVAGLGAIFTSFIIAVLSYIRQWIGLYINSVYGIKMSSALLKHLLQLPVEWFEKRNIGGIISRFSSLKQIQNSLITGVVQGFLNALVSIMTLVLMTIYSGKLTVISIVGLSIYFVLKQWVYSSIREASQEKIIKSAEEESSFIQTVRSISAIKLFSKEDVRFQEWLNKLVGASNAGIRFERYNITLSVLQSLLSGIEHVIIIWIGAMFVLNNSMTIGMLFAFIAWREQFVGGVYGFVNGYFSFKLMSIHLDRVSDIALEKAEFDNSEFESLTLIEKEDVSGTIELRKICYRFGQDEKWLFKDLSLVIQSGESVAMVGPSGIGKTTLIKIMAGLIAAEDGVVSIDGFDIKKIGKKKYRSFCASVMQGDTLLPGSIEQNIAFFDADVDKNHVLRCAEMANILSEIDAMPMGFNTILGEMGGALSGGQIQRVLLARALYQNPKILFLDESTSNLDIQSENIINKNLSELKLTRIIIAHRQDSIRMVDRIIDIAQLRAS